MDRELVALALAERVTGVKIPVPGVAVEVSRWNRDLADVVLAVVISRIDEIERVEYREGLRCRDFKEALDLVRDALGETP